MKKSFLKSLAVVPVLLLAVVLLAACNNGSGGGFSGENQKLVGSWTTGCKVPDPNSKWAELHTFVFNADNTAVHTRDAFYKKSCDGGPDMHDVNSYNFNIEEVGKIDFMDLGAGVPMYDIYALSGDSLQFGHGFRNDAVYGGAGISPESRIHILNTFLTYHRQ